MEIGIDLEQNKRFDNVSEKFLMRVFSNSEISYAKKFSDYSAKLCAMWCAKEAVIKAFSDAKLSYKDIEIEREETGKPYVKENDKIKKELKKRSLTQIKISLSHSKTHSTAICILN